MESYTDLRVGKLYCFKRTF